MENLINNDVLPEAIVAFFFGFTESSVAYFGGYSSFQYVGDIEYFSLSGSTNWTVSLGNIYYGDAGINNATSYT